MTVCACGVYSSPSPSAVRFHLDVDRGDEMGEAGDGGSGSSASIHRASPPDHAPLLQGDERREGGEANKTGGGEAGKKPQEREVHADPAAVAGPPKRTVSMAPEVHGRVSRASSDAAAIEMLDRASNKSTPALHRAKSVSHWHDSRISVEMHLALYIEDLMMLAPGVAGEGKQAKGDGASLPTAPVAGGSSVVSTDSAERSAHSSAAPVDLPVEFDEDAEPDVTLQHVLAGVEYLLQTRIIGTANPMATEGRGIQEEDEDEFEEGEEKDATGGARAAFLSPGLDAAGNPAPLTEAPVALADSGPSNAPAVPLPPASKHPYFYFVSLDLQLCDDLVTALCYHMRRAEQKWSMRPKASPEAIKAMQIFEGFFRYVYTFRCCVSARSTSYLRAALKVNRHLRSSDQAHRKLVVRLLLVLASECARIDSWEQLVDADEVPRVRDMLTAPEVVRLRKKLAGQKDYERENSVSRMNSFRYSRTGAEEGGSTNGTTNANASALASFPAFFSTRHSRLLPPKGALYDVEPKRLLSMFCTSAEKGLSPDEIAERQAMYGMNTLPPPIKPSWLQLIWGQLKDFIILVLLAASVISMATQDWKAAGVLLFVVLVNVVIGLVQEHRAAQALESLNSFSVPQATVMRAGEATVLPASELVPGDIVILDEGVNVPADVRLIDVSQLATIEAILTGESLPVVKTTAAIKPRGRRYLTVGDRVNMAFMSTLVSKGRATAIVVNTGPTTEVGRIYSALAASQSGNQLTPLQKKLATLGKWLVLIALVSCALVVGIGLGRGYGSHIVEVGISLAVSVIPEGLVTVVTLTMAVGVTRMAARKAIVRNLPAVETLGAVTTICSDKTGTLTEGKMKTDSMWAVAPTQDGAAGGAQSNGGHTLRFVTASNKDRVSAPVTVVPESNTDPASDASSAAPAVSIAINPPAATAPVSALLNETTTLSSASQLPIPLLWNNLVCCLNNNATVKVQDVVDAAGKVIGQEEVMVGDATEVALLRASQQCFCSVSYWHRTYGLPRVLEFAFDSDRKRMSVVLALPAADAAFNGVRRPADATHMLLVKGAPESILSKSISHLAEGADGIFSVTPLSDPIEASIEEQGSVLAGRGQRVLATAFKFLTQAQFDQLKADQENTNKEAEAAAGGAKSDEASGPSLADLSCARAESDLCFIGLAGIFDPPRVEVPAAIARAHTAGIRVVMITGDHFQTALSIAKMIGIFSDARGDRAMNGDALAVLTEEQLAALQPFPVVFSRVSPENKLKLVKSLQRRGDVTAMTGDGVNDSPAIKQADVGIAMGLGGTEVTRQAADIVLSDDDFSTIVEAVEEGRRILDNIVKFLVYLLSCNGAEVCIMLLSVCAGWEVPYLPLMILWANIFVDIPPSLALGLEKVDPHAMERAPRGTNSPVLSGRILLVMAFDAAVMAIIVLLNYWHMIYERHLSVGYARSFAFLLLAIIHLLHAWVSSSLTGTILRRDLISNNPSMLWAILVSTLFVVGGHYVPGLNTILELEPIHGHEWGILFWNFGIFLVVVEARKFVMRTWEGRSKLDKSNEPINKIQSAV